MGLHRRPILICLLEEAETLLKESGVTEAAVLKALENVRKKVYV